MTREELREWVDKLRDVDPDITGLVRAFECNAEYDEEYKVQEWFPSLTQARLQEIHDAAKSLQQLVEQLQIDLNTDRFGPRS